MKKKKKEALYAPLQFVQSVIPEPEAEWTKDLTECEEHFAHLRSIKLYGLKDTPQNRQNIARSAFMAADWNRSKQAYRFFVRKIIDKGLNDCYNGNISFGVLKPVNAPKPADMIFETFL